MTQTIFISYSWKDAQLADRIEKAFMPTGMDIKRDIRDIKYKGSIKDFMKQVRKTDFVILLISDTFLKSPNCMFEVLELMKDSNFEDRILPIVVDATNIFTATDKIGYIKYWDQQYNDLEERLQHVKTTDALPIYHDLKHIDNIRGSVAQFLDSITSINCPSFSSLETNNFSKIFDYLGLKMEGEEFIREILTVSKIEDDEEREIRFEQLDQKYPNNAKVYFSKAYRAFVKGRIKASIHLYERAIELDPTFSASYFNLAFNYDTYIGDYEEAKKLYSKAIELDPKNSRALNNLGRLYSQHFEEIEISQRYFQQAIDADPFDHDAYFNLGSTFQKALNTTAAKENYEKALQLKPDFIDAKYNYGILLYNDLKKYFEAKKQFEEILELQPEHKKTLKKLGQLLEFEYKHYTTAKLYYDRFIEVKPNSADDHYFYAVFLKLYFPSQKKLALEHYQIACEMDIAIRTEKSEIFFNANYQ